MATLTPVNPEVYKCDTPMERTNDHCVLNGQTWKAGQFLFTDAAGLLKACATDAYTNTGGIKFQALSDQTDPNNNTTVATVGVITEDMVFTGNILSGSTVVSGLNYGINVASNVVTIDTGETTNAAVQIVGLMATDSPVEFTTSDTYEKVLFKVRKDLIDCTGV